MVDKKKTSENQSVQKQRIFSGRLISLPHSQNSSANETPVNELGEVQVCVNSYTINIENLIPKRNSCKKNTALTTVYVAFPTMGLLIGYGCARVLDDISRGTASPALKGTVIVMAVLLGFSAAAFIHCLSTCSDDKSVEPGYLPLANQATNVEFDIDDAADYDNVLNPSINNNDLPSTSEPSLSKISSCFFSTIKSPVVRAGFDLAAATGAMALTVGVIKLLEQISRGTVELPIAATIALAFCAAVLAGVGAHMSQAIIVGECTAPSASR